MAINVAKININEVITAKVTSIEEYGIWVDFNGIKGLIRDVDLEWQRKPVRTHDYAKEGFTLKLFVKSFSKDQKVFYGSLKDLHPELNPWKDRNVYMIGKPIKGKVQRKTDFGYIVILETGAMAILENQFLENEIPLNKLITFKIKEVDTVLIKLNLFIVPRSSS